ncbi:MAG: transcriptional regulator [Oscillochloris sp.]|nr:transcriptional regulator [Oscillochloris sp.]
MHNPCEVFASPLDHWAFLTAPLDTDFEGQHFDRKEAGRLAPGMPVLSSKEMSQVMDQVRETVSAFTNSNIEGGLLVVGISKTGEVKGIDHLNDEQRSRLTAIGHLLRNQAAQAKFVPCHDVAGSPRTICLVYAPYVFQAICETLENMPRSWERVGSQNMLLSQHRRDQLLRDKRVVDFEQMHCGSFDAADLDDGLLTEFRRGRSGSTDDERPDQRLLYEINAITREGPGGNLLFTKAGVLFFAANPQRLLPKAYIRLLRFESLVAEPRSLPTLDKTFAGPITKQIRDMRTFIRETGFFKTYQRRNATGGFSEEPEFPFFAVDEAIVNAVAHRDYAVELPIECEYYRDAFVVKNPGRVIQRGHDVPDHFSLDKLQLSSRPRNALLTEWLRSMRGPQGTPFIQALAEGTRRMKLEMEKLKLPAPVYDVTTAETRVTLYSKAVEREAALQADLYGEAAGATNLFPLAFLGEDGLPLGYQDIRIRQKDILLTLRNKLQAQGWFIDSYRFGRIVTHLRSSDIALPQAVTSILRFYPAYSIGLRSLMGQFYLCIDYVLIVKNVRTIQKLLADLSATDIVGQRAVAQIEQEWLPARIISVDAEWSVVYLYDLNEERPVPNARVIPELSLPVLKSLLQKYRLFFDLHREIKKHSLALERNASRTRFDHTRYTAEEFSQAVFPLTMPGLRVTMSAVPAPLYRGTAPGKGFQLRGLREPFVAFNKQAEATNIRDGITQFGTWESEPRTIEIIPVCIAEQRQNMARLIEQLKTGKFKYRGSERTFGVRLTYSSIVTASDPAEVVTQCHRLLQEHPDWREHRNLDQLFLVHTPELGYESDDEGSPYYRAKRLLLEAGIPCQMVDTPSLEQPDMKDLNLALNIITKCGITPWVLPDAIPDADFFIGLSYTQSRHSGGQRLMGYANVFNQYGRWLFYSANTQTFAYEDRQQHYQELVTQTLSGLSLSDAPNIYFHYSAKFSRDDREAILAAARRIRPRGTYSFVWINTHHHVRLYDTRPETDGSVPRGSYIVGSSHQFYLSTTGFNPYRRTLGTPQVLEATIWVDRPDHVPTAPPDLRSLAMQLLSLTKLNWASTDSLCAEPITIKYAGDIAYLTDAFLRQGSNFELHPRLQKTPWFL